MCYHFKIKENVRLLFVLDIIIISLFILKRFILMIKLQYYGTLIVHVCTIQLMEHLELELDEVMTNYEYMNMNICINICLVVVLLSFNWSLNYLYQMLRIIYLVGRAIKIIKMLRNYTLYHHYSSTSQLET